MVISAGFMSFNYVMEELATVIPAKAGIQGFDYE